MAHLLAVATVAGVRSDKLSRKEIGQSSMFFAQLFPLFYFNNFSQIDEKNIEITSIGGSMIGPQMFFCRLGELSSKMFEFFLTY